MTEIATEVRINGKTTGRSIEGLPFYSCVRCHYEVELSDWFKELVGGDREVYGVTHHPDGYVDYHVEEKHVSK